MLSRRYWPGVILTIPIGVFLGFWVAGGMNRSVTVVGATDAFLLPAMLMGGGTALGAMMGGLLATRRVDAQVGSSTHLLAVGLGAAIGAAGFWVVVSIVAVCLGGAIALPWLVGAGIIAGCLTGLLSAAAVALADLAAWAMRPRPV